MRNQGLGSWTARRARKTPDRLAVVHGDTELTYRQLHQRTVRLAHGLRGLGVRRGDRVAFLGPNHAAYLETLFAVGQLGAVFVPLNMRLAGPELAYMLDDSGSSVLVHTAGYTQTVDAIRAETAVRHHIAVPDGTPTPADTAAPPDRVAYEALLGTGPVPEPFDEAVSLDDTCIVMYTSGTTGRPKGAVLTHGNLIWNSINVVVDSDLASDEVAIVSAPLFHTAGLNMCCLPTILKGGTVILVQAFHPDTVIDLVEQRRATFMFGVPAMYEAIAASPRWPTADLSSIRLLTCGGAPVPPATIRTYLDRGMVFVQGYGMTEAAPGTLLLDADHVIDHAGSAGVPHFFTDVRVVDPDLRDVAAGEKGEVVVQGPNVFTGYWGRPEETSAVLADGWFHSGDVAVVDEDGFAFIVDRMKDMIISGGENIYPAEVEKVLADHPAVAECAVIGVPDPRWGEVGRAVVALRPGHDATADDLTAFLRSRLARYKVPASVHFVDALPRNASGKVLKLRLRESHGDV